jgi:hypothetical protein
MFLIQVNVVIIFYFYLNFALWHRGIHVFVMFLLNANISFANPTFCYFVLVLM